MLWRETARPRLRAGLAGFLASFASVVEIQVGPVSALLGLYAVALAVGRRRPLGTIASFALGALPPTLVLLGYNTLAFGSPWRMGYFFEVLDRFKEVHSSSNPLGMGRPDWSRLDDLLWGERRGLVWFAPIVGLTIPGLVTLGRRRFWGMLSVVTGTIGSVVLVNLCYPEWTGGWSTGPRLLVPMLPFALIPVAAWLAPGGRLRVTLAGLLALAGALVILAYVAVGARVPDAVGRPWVEGVWPLLSGVRPLPGWVFGTPYARNLTTLVFPDLLKALPRWAGWATVLPLVALQGVMIAGMLRVVREPDLKRS